MIHAPLLSATAVATTHMTSSDTTTPAGRSVIRTLAAARLLGLAGAEVVFTIRSFEMFRDTGSALWVSALMFAFFTGLAVGGPVAGALADRYPRQRVLLGGTVVQIAALAPLVVVREPAAIIALTLVAAVATAPYATALPAAVPSLVAPGDIAWANGLLNAGLNAGLIAGPVCGGLILDAYGRGVGFAAAIGLIALEGALILTTRGALASSRDSATGEDTSFLRGLSVVRADRLLRAITVAWMILMGGLGVVLVAEVPLAEGFGWDATGYALLAVAWGAGAVCGSLMARRLRARNEPAAVAVGLAVLGLALAAIAVSQAPWWVMAALFAGGLSDAAGEVAVHGVFQRRVHEAVLGRGMAVLNTAGVGALALSFLVAGPMLEAVGVAGAYWISAGAAAVGAAYYVMRLRTAPGPARPGPDGTISVTSPDDDAIRVTQATPRKAPTG